MATTSLTATKQFDNFLIRPSFIIQYSSTYNVDTAMQVFHCVLLLRCCTDIWFTTEEIESLLVWPIHRSFPHTHVWFVCALVLGWWVHDYVNVHHLVEVKKPQPNSKPSASLLSSALDWELRTFLSKRLKFPDHVTPTFLRPGVLHTQVSSKQVLLFNLTVSQEYCMEKANKCIWLKYWELTNQCRRSSWRMYCEPIEVGCWCLAACFLCKT